MDVLKTLAVISLSGISKESWVSMQERWQEAETLFYYFIIPQMQVISVILFKCVKVILSILL